MVYWQLFLAFFIPNMVGYGGGPAIIPLIEAEVVGHYQLMESQAFSETLALGNVLASPIATKMAGYIGYEVAGVSGACIAVFATIAPTLLLMIVLVSLLYRFRHSKQVKAMSQYVKPVVAVMMALLTYKFIHLSWGNSGWQHTLLLVGFGYWALIRWHWPHAAVISLAMLYGGLFIR